MRRDFGDLQNLPQDLRSFGRFCGPQTTFARDLDSIKRGQTIKHWCSYLFTPTLYRVSPLHSDHTISMLSVDAGFLCSEV